MYSKEQTYVDFNGEKKTKVFRFNLMESEQTKLYVTTEGGLKAYVQKIVDENDAKKLYLLFEEIIDLAYGEKTADGDFIKSPEILARFRSSQAYSDIIMEFINDEKKASDFINTLIQNTNLDVRAENHVIELQDHKKPQNNGNQNQHHNN